MLSKLNKNLGIKLFNNPNTLNYTLFNKLYSYFILKKKNIDNEILQYHQKGYVKTQSKSLELVDFINDNIISKQEKNIRVIESEARHLFLMPEDCREKILKLIKKDYGNLIQKLEKYYNNKIAILEIKIQRNFPINGNEDYYQNRIRDKTKEPYSNYYHVDYYVGTFFKMFINLQKVSEENGPLNLYDIGSTKEFLIKNEYKNRNNYIVSDLKDKLFINTGDKGQTVIANTTKCLHRAENVKTGKRDIMFITFGAIPEKLKNNDLNNQFDYYEKQNPESVWTHNGKFTKLSKPKNLRSTIKLMFDLIKSKTF